MTLHDCDICGSSERRALWVALRYTEQGCPVICQNCGFVYVPERRSSAEIAEDWKRLYSEKIYDPTWPGVKARLYYVAEWIDQNIGLEGKTLLDIGGGAGTFAGIAHSFFDALPQHFDPAFGGTVSGGELAEDFQPQQKYDIVTILWTLENCGDCNAMIAKARECLKPDGHLVVATGSRILVPFRKPMSAYFSKEPQDLHAFRWSAMSLMNIVINHGFRNVKYNDFHQNDVLLMSAQVGGPVGGVIRESAQSVENHFIDWYRMFP